MPLLDGLLTPCLAPTKKPMAVRGALIPNQRMTIINIVPKGTAPDDPAKTRKRSKRKTTTNTKLSHKEGLRCVL